MGCLRSGADLSFFICAIPRPERRGPDAETAFPLSHALLQDLSDLGVIQRLVAA